ncbi:MAG: hypothetical protein MRJ65_15980 [Candidatus Brocadiaceae bacterium]|nr:hypothetical protein [Candidatus Brocadiaceae bacterium]
MKMSCFSIFFVLFCLPAGSDAHSLYLSAEDGQLHAYYTENAPVSHAEVTVVDENGLVILQDKTNGEGLWLLPMHLTGSPRLIVVTTPDGHRAQIAWRKALEGTSQVFFDLLIVRLGFGILIIGGTTFLLKRFLKK